ncbi:DUF2726 domain-containing protein [Sedimentibacter sp.]|uniref:DUF2726 domain-containing protein n=1 Tax=Sedimentibacter sp. TaxID=1960295 RepID=UPI0028AAA92C|nr:DUF2726 domain-containing protein [Sedimentibacter sp.]
MTNLIIIIVFIIVIFMLAVAIIAIISKSDKSDKNISYDNFIKLDSILSEAEFNFYNVLNLALQNSNFIICPKVRIADFINVKSNKNFTSDLNRIKSKHVDFLICNNRLKPLIAIELDDKSHDKRIERDNFINELYKSVNLNTLRIKNGQTYSVIELRNKLKEII